MKSPIRYIVPLVGLALALPALLAEDAAPTEKKELHVVAGPGPDDNAPPPAPQHQRHVMKFGDPQEMESVTFLGIATAPAFPALADQLNLAPGTGLVVTMVAPDSPATRVLRQHDVLVKLDDQLLIEQRQLSVLVRDHQEGDEVTLTYIRGGKEATAKVKLGKHDMPKLALMGAGPHNGGLALAMGGAGAMAGPGREEMDRVLALIHHGAEPFAPGEPMADVQIERHAGPGMRSVTVSTSNSNMVYSDKQGSLDLTIKDGQRTLIAKNAKGEQLYSGPVNTPEERKALPADVRVRLDKLEGMQEYSFKTDGDFTPGEVKDARPRQRGITLPLPPAPAARPPTFF